MKAPVSKQLAYDLIFPCIAITATGVINLLKTGQKQGFQNIILVICFGIPAIYFTTLLLNKKTIFRTNKKVRQSERLCRLSFSSTAIFPALVLSSFLIAVGLITNSHLFLLFGLLALTLTVCSAEHPKIWFSDTFNTDDAIEKFKEAPIGSSFAYEDGIFSYGDGWFAIQLGEETQTIKWDDIVLIKAYKLDLFTVDCIVINIHLADNLVAINDQTPGHMKFMEIASQQLHHFKDDWFMAVAFPAFATNLTIIYKKIIP